VTLKGSILIKKHLKHVEVFQGKSCATVESNSC
jgi:hypothetical protein